MTGREKGTGTEAAAAAAAVGAAEGDLVTGTETGTGAGVAVVFERGMGPDAGAEGGACTMLGLHQLLLCFLPRWVAHAFPPLPPSFAWRTYTGASLS